MAYSRRSRRLRRRNTRRPIRRSRTIRRRTTTRRRPMTRRRILNVSTEKCQDNRLTFSNVNAGANPPIFTAPILSPGAVYVMPYMCTAMDKTVAGSTNPIQGYRTRDDVFMRGYRERVAISTNDGTCWNLRRICFTLKGNVLINAHTNTTPLYQETVPNGFVRSCTDANGTGLGAAIFSEVFKGQINIDWTDTHTAALDTNRITVKYDKQFRFQAPNDAGMRKTFKLWHPMNANFYYRNEENGDTGSDSVAHVSGNHGMGDYYIVDFWKSDSQNTESRMIVNYEGTLFWHER